MTSDEFAACVETIVSSARCKGLSDSAMAVVLEATATVLGETEAPRAIVDSLGSRHVTW